jgi:UDP-N-acetylglucosamine:LPS N-acetylglucosamine transferase
MDGYFSPVDRHHLDYPFPPRLRFVKTGLPARRRFFDLACTRGDVDRVLFMAGYWGQMSFRRVVNVLSPLLRDLRTLRFDVVCGVNERLDHRLRTYFKNEPRVTVHGKKDSVEELLGGCASVITKPGFATIVETRAADRALFLLKGMPVAEDHNAAYAITHLGGRWFTVEDFELWYRGGRGLGGTLPWRAIPPLF